MAEYARRPNAERALSDQLRRNRVQGISSHGGEVLVVASGQVLESGDGIIQWSLAEQHSGDIVTPVTLSGPANTVIEMPPGVWIVSCHVKALSDFGMDLDGGANAFLSFGSTNTDGGNHISGEGYRTIAVLSASDAGNITVSAEYDGTNLDRFTAELTAWKGVS